MGVERTLGLRREEGQQAVGQRILRHNHRNQGVLVLARTLVHILAVGRILGRILVRTVKKVSPSVDRREIRIANLMSHVSVRSDFWVNGADRDAEEENPGGGGGVLTVGIED